MGNAGDFLIRERTLALLGELRPDRDLVLHDRWRSLDPESPEVKDAAAIVLAGGPALQRSMYPGIYPLSSPLAQLAAPIVPFGLGWKGRVASSSEVFRFRFDRSSRELLARIEADGLVGTSRDAPSVRVMQRAGLTRNVLGGCPAWYDMDAMGRPTPELRTVEHLVVSTGVLPVRSPLFFEQQVDVLRSLAARYPNAQRVAAFHHALSPEEQVSVEHGSALRLLAREAEQLGYEIVDVSGNAQGMESLYGRTDLHIGYRVHAHILRSSLRRPSVLLAEDARAYGAGEALGSPWLTGVRLQRIAGRLRRFSGHRLGAVVPVANLSAQLSRLLDEQESSGWSYLRKLPELQDRHLAVCRRAVESWP